MPAAFIRFSPRSPLTQIAMIQTLPKRHFRVERE